MKKLSRLMALFAIAGMTTFLTGCGDDDGGDDDGGVVNRAPTTDAELRAREFTLTAAGAQGQEVLIFPAQGTYQITSGAEVFTGTYSNPTFGENQTTVTLNPDNPAPGNEQGVLTLTFSPAGGSGTYAFTPAGQGTVEQGTFTYTIPGNTTDGGGGGGPQFAPATQAELVAQDYTATTVDGAVVLDFPTENTYTITSSEGTETGNFTATLNGETWTLNLVPTTADPNATLALTWNSANSGTFIYTPVDGPPESGTFVEGGGSSTNGGTDGGGGSGLAPANIVGSWNLNVASGPFAGDFIANYDGTTFSIVRASDGAAAGNGTYTYTVSTGNTDQARLVHTYTTPDQDDFLLTFTSQTAATFTGTQISGTGGTPQAASGTFVRQ